MKYAGEAGIPRDTAWMALTDAQRDWVINGSPHWAGKWNKQWYGIKRFFEYLESKAYKMHIRVLLSKYRSYTPCPVCGGARLKTEALLWRLGSKADADGAMPPSARVMPQGVPWTRDQLEALPGLTVHDLMLMPIERIRRFFDGISLPSTLLDEALKLLLDEIRTRLRYLCDVGIGYLTLDRQSRTLSGGEVQRINLTTALGTSLVNTMFVLDEPSIGLHPRDMNRIIEAMQRLRDAGNTLVVVEHDPAVMLAADRLIDMGPGPGERGGQIVFDGTPEAIRSADTLTGAYLGGRKHVSMGIKRLVGEATPRLILEGVRDHNLKNVTVEFPLRHLVCVTGVSGSGKSTLMQDVLYPALQRHFGKATESPGAHDRLLGADWLNDAVFVDQSPIGKTARSNPASYVGAFDEIRKLFAQAPLAVQRGYGAGMFSFNAGDGRCPTCGGSGFEHVEMQFLSDVYLRCQDCDGRRYRAELLDVKIDRRLPGDVIRDLSVADVLELTVSEAVQLFRDDREVLRVLQPIVDVGLEYVKLGQPVPTLRGGEAQRLKLAGFLAEAAQGGSASRQALAKRGTLYLFDEPTTGLHFDDIAKLMRAFRKLLDAGHSIIVIEHNLDVIRASDWLIDLGPEGGEAGGELVCAGTPEEVKRHPTSHTGKALLDYDRALGVDGLVAEEGLPLQSLVKRQRDERRVSERADPHRERARAQPAVARREHPARKVQRHHRRVGLGQEHAGLRHPLQRGAAALPRIAQCLCAQHRAAGRSARGGCGVRHSAHGGDRAAPVARWPQEHRGHDHRGVALPAPALRQAGPAALHARTARRSSRRAPRASPRSCCAITRASTSACSRRWWSTARACTPTSPSGPRRAATRTCAWTASSSRWTRGRGWTASRSTRWSCRWATSSSAPTAKPSCATCWPSALDLGKGVMHLLAPLDGLKGAMLTDAPTAHIGSVKVFSTKRACPVCGTSYPELDPRMFSYNSKHGWCTTCVGTGLALTREQRKAYDDSKRDDDDNKGREQSFPSEETEVEGLVDAPCPDCDGTRLNLASRGVTFESESIAAVAQWSVTDCRGLGRGAAARRGATPTSRATWSPRSAAASSSSRKSAWVT